MESIILLNHDAKVQEVIEEEKSNFLRSILLEMGVPIDFWEEPKILSIEEKLKLNNLLGAFNIQVLDNLEIMQIYVNNELIGEFYRPTYKLKKDLHQIDPKRKLYIEVKIETASIFDKKEENTG